MAHKKMHRINPAFNRFPNEADIIGRLLVAFGELELSFCRNAGQAIGMLYPTLKALYRLRATSSRIDAADAFMRPAFDAAEMSNEYQTTTNMVWHCLKIRNQFAHCNWGDDSSDQSAGLFFSDLQEAAKANTGFEYFFKHVDGALLERHESYFSWTLEWLEFLNHELAVKQDRLISHVWPKPEEQEPPPLHNSPSQHVPPWLTEDQKALHLARALAAQGGSPTPTPGQIVLDKQRAEKRAKRQAARVASAKGSSAKNPPEGR